MQSPNPGAVSNPPSLVQELTTRRFRPEPDQESTKPPPTVKTSGDHSLLILDVNWSACLWLSAMSQWTHCDKSLPHSQNERSRQLTSLQTPPESSVGRDGRATRATAWAFSAEQTAGLLQSSNTHICVPHQYSGQGVPAPMRRWILSCVAVPKRQCCS